VAQERCRVAVADYNSPISLPKL